MIRSICSKLPIKITAPVLLTVPVLVVAAVLSVVAFIQGRAAVDDLAIDPRARKILKEMNDYLRAAQTFTIRTEISQ